MITKIEHIAIAVDNLQEAIVLWENLLGVACYKQEEVTGQKVITAFFRIGEVKIELLAGTHETSPVTKFISRRGAGLHHIALSTTDLEGEIDRLQTQNFTFAGEASVRGAENKLIRFIQPSSNGGALVELCTDQ